MKKRTTVIKGPTVYDLNMRLRKNRIKRKKPIRKDLKQHRPWSHTYPNAHVPSPEELSAQDSKAIFVSWTNDQGLRQSWTGIPGVTANVTFTKPEPIAEHRVGYSAAINDPCKCPPSPTREMIIDVEIDILFWKAKKSALFCSKCGKKNWEWAKPKWSWRWKK